MSQEIKNELGSVHISEDVISVVAALAAMECYGLVGMASRRVKDGLAELLGRDNIRKGVTVSLEEDTLVVELNIIVEYGINISEVANNIIDRVNYAIQKATGVEADRIQINVQGVRIGNAS